MIRSHRHAERGRFWSGALRHRRRSLIAAMIVAGMLAGLGIPPAASAADVSAQFDWVMPERTHWNNEYGSVDVSAPSRAYLSPTSWPVTLDACASGGAPIAMRFDIQLPDRVETIDRPWTSASCTVDFTFPHLGYFPTTLTVRSIFGETSVSSKTVIVRDFLVVSMGDSLASGEGNPDVAGPPLWYDRRCHRSGKSGPARAALQLEQLSRQFSVTFLSVACSGASITSGLMGEYDGQEDVGLGPIPPQVKDVGWLLCPANVTCNSKWDIREIDALVVNIGGNDLHFSKIVIDCAWPEPSTPCHLESTIKNRLADDLAQLPGKLDNLATMMDDWLRYSTAYFPEYFDPTRDNIHDFCTMDVGPGEISGAESAWAFLKVITPLNTELGKATARHHQQRWKYLGGVMDRYATNGYCATNSFIVNYDQSLAWQRNRDGVMHPNWWGHAVYADTLFNAFTGR